MRGRSTWSIDGDFHHTGILYRTDTSCVLKGTCLHSGLGIVLKVYQLDKISKELLHTLVREVRIHSALQHRSIINLYGSFKDGNRLVLVQERAHRGDLYRVHRELMGSRMSEGRLAALVLAPLLDALVYIHSKGVCHRDIKPENLLVCEDWTLKLADFGASINLLEERAVTRTGTADYMAPEVTRCPLKVRASDNKHDASLAYTTAADIWSVGVLAFEMLVGFPPSSSADPYDSTPWVNDVLARQGDCMEADAALRFPKFVSPGARDFISSALAHDPLERPTSAQLLRHPWLRAEAAAFRARQAKLQQARVR